jgi:hypothetical protein
MTRKRQDRYLEGLEKRRAEALAKQSEDGADNEPPRPSEDKVLVERPPALWPAKKRRPPWR